MPSFLQRFSGKYEVITKLGPKESGREASVYREMQNSLSTMPFHQHKYNIAANPLSQDSAIPKAKFQLPLINSRFKITEVQSCDQYGKNKDGRSGVFVCHFDKETNWKIQSARKLYKKEANFQRLFTKQNRESSPIKRQSLNKHKNQKSMLKLGGLGANIGGQQWQNQYDKAIKAKTYAEQLKKIHRQRLTRQQNHYRSLMQ